MLSALRQDRKFQNFEVCFPYLPNHIGDCNSAISWHTSDRTISPNPRSPQSLTQCCQPLVHIILCTSIETSDGDVSAASVSCSLIRAKSLRASSSRVGSLSSSLKLLVLKRTKSLLSLSRDNTIALSGARKLLVDGRFEKVPNLVSWNEPLRRGWSALQLAVSLQHGTIQPIRSYRRRATQESLNNLYSVGA